jgi:hypothetical protein
VLVLTPLVPVKELVDELLFTDCMEEELDASEAAKRGSRYRTLKPSIVAFEKVPWVF